jgi:hypothetical protein
LVEITPTTNLDIINNPKGNRKFGFDVSELPIPRPSTNLTEQISGFNSKSNLTFKSRSIVLNKKKGEIMYLVKRLMFSILAGFVVNVVSANFAIGASALNEHKVTIVPEIGNTSFHVTGLQSSYRSASMIGAAARFRTDNDRLTWSVGAQYLQAGFKQRIEFGIFTIDVAEVATDYLTVPLKSEFLLSHPSTVGLKYFLSAGLTPSYLLSAKFKDLLHEDADEKGIRSEMNGLDVLVGLGFGGRYETAIGDFDFGLEYHKGQMDLIKDQRSRNEGFIAKAGYNIAI